MSNFRKLSINKTYFFKTLVKYSLLFLLPISILGSYSLYRFNKETRQTIEARNWNLMHQIQNEADSLFQTVDIISTYLSSNSSLTKTLQEIFLHDVINSSEIITKNILGQYLQSILASNEYTYFAQLYYDNDFHKILTASGTFSYMYKYTENNPLNKYFESDSDFGIENRQINTYSYTLYKEVITIYKKLYSTHHTNLPQGILLINFSSDRFKEYINHFDLYPQQVILFVAENGTTVMQSQPGDFSNIWSQIEPNLHSKNEYTVFSTIYNDCSYLVSLIPSDSEKLFYVSLIPTTVLYEQTQTLSAVLWLVIIAAGIISIFLSWLNTRYEYKQLKNIIDIFSDIENNISYQKNLPIKHENPYHIILHNLLNMFLEQNYLKLQLENKQYQLQLLELRALQHQINPHFLYNTLNVIYWEAIRLSDSSNSCSSMISDLSDIMAYSLSDVQNQVPLCKELEFLEHYTNIQKKRYNHEFDVLFDIDDEVLNMPIIKMLLQPLVENAISHGINKKDGHGMIKIKIYHRSPNITFHILDNGKGITDDKLASLRSQLQPSDTTPLSDHIGLINTNRRLCLAYGTGSAIRLYSRINIGTIISFSIPAQKSSEETESM